ncbi:hypothetical protein CEXT_747551 [Caerostris extrusa]|uniref:Uncharacterized protein n=1 Tax=Caerostris extrusa TaxID=172846 RepID=A0AAV4T6U1_CAEEX|nr:hypothetical protein CEXT_747551 [Caerostris extrusa]
MVCKKENEGFEVRTKDGQWEKETAQCYVGPRPLKKGENVKVYEHLDKLRFLDSVRNSTPNRMSNPDILFEHSTRIRVECSGTECTAWDSRPIAPLHTTIFLHMMMAA